MTNLESVGAFNRLVDIRVQDKVQGNLESSWSSRSWAWLKSWIPGGATERLHGSAGSFFHQQGLARLKSLLLGRSGSGRVGIGSSRKSLLLKA